MADTVKCVIIGSVPDQDAELLKTYTENAYVICADGGYDIAVKYGIPINLVVGDFDSSEKEPPKGIETIVLPSHKDDTDTMFAIKEGFQRGYHEFVLLGVLGGQRFDHSIANLSALHYIATHGGNGLIVDRNMQIFLLVSGRLVLTQMEKALISVFPFGCPYCTVTYYGLEYPLTKHPLYANDPLGVSNHILAERAEVILHDGNALIIVQQEPK